MKLPKIPPPDGVFSIVLERFTPMEAALASQLKRDFGRLNRLGQTLLGISIAVFILAAIAVGITVEQKLFTGAAFVGGLGVALAVAGGLNIVYFGRERRRIQVNLRALWASHYAPPLLDKLLRFQAAQAEAEQHDDLFQFLVAELVSAPELVVARARVAAG
ncbi:MAG: hypothetical protein Q8R35_04000 [bacterium]|nr:hypothetical protein [bacterium]